MKADEKALIETIKDAVMARLKKAANGVKWSKLMAAMTAKYTRKDIATAIELLRHRGRLVIEIVGGKGSGRRGRPGRKLVLA